MSFGAYAIHFAFATVCAGVALKHIVLADVFHMRWQTLLSMRAFFALTCASQVLTIVGEGGQHPAQTWISAASLVALVLMIVGILLDQKRAVNRMANALDAIRDRFDGLAVVRGERGRKLIQDGKAERLDAGRVIADTVNAALLAPDERPESEQS